MLSVIVPYNVVLAQQDDDIVLQIPSIISGAVTPEPEDDPLFFLFEEFKQ